MAKVISQDTYDDVLKENIIEFSMSVEEARKETIEQFEAQGINLGNIIRDLTINEETGKPIMSEAIEHLKNHVEKTKILKDDELEKTLDVLMSELCKSVPHRVQAGKNNAQELLLKQMQVEIEKGDSDGHKENSVKYLQKPFEANLQVSIFRFFTS